MNAQEIAVSNMPGADLVSKGLIDLGNRVTTAEAILVLVAAPRLRRLDIHVPDWAPVSKPFEHALYTLLEDTHGPSAYSQYNALIRRIVSFSRALEREMGARTLRGK